VDEEILSTVLSENTETFEQIRLTVNEFREVQYLHIRKYYLDYDGEYKPTKKGLAIPISIDTIANLYNGLVELLAKSDVLEVLLEHSDITKLREIIEKIEEEKV